MKGLAHLFFFVDAAFVIIFSVCCLIYANHDVFLILMVIVGLITVYPLYIYIDTYTKDDSVLTVSWYVEHFNMLMLYCLLRFFMLFGFFSWVLIDLSQISVSTVITHFPVFVIVSLFFMLAAMIVLVFLALRLVPRQRAVVYEFVKRHETEDEEDEKEEIRAPPPPSEGFSFASFF